MSFLNAHGFNTIAQFESTLALTPALACWGGVQANSLNHLRTRERETRPGPQASFKEPWGEIGPSPSPRRYETGLYLGSAERSEVQAVCKAVSPVFLNGLNLYQ